MNGSELCELNTNRGIHVFFCERHLVLGLKLEA